MWSFLILFISILLLLLYSSLIILYRIWFKRLVPFSVSVDHSPKTSFSVIIPARNEALNIYACLSSILNQEYPGKLFEVIVIDDFSTDNTVTIIKTLQTKHANLQLIQLADELQGEKINAYKKKAIEIGIRKSSGDWIVTTDADCSAEKQWLCTLDATIQFNQPVFIAAPVVFKKDKTLLSLFQYFDFLSLQGITAASVSAGFHSMCNGANLAYEKAVFYEVDGFAGIDMIASGDDMLLMNKMKEKYPERISYVFSKDAIISTDPMPDLKSFLNQRIRWASKADTYKDKGIFFVLLLVYCFNVSLCLLFITALFNHQLIFLFFLVVLLKTVVELSFILPVLRFFGNTGAIWFPLLQPFHIIYTVVAGWLGKFGNYSWKERQVK